LPGAEQVTYVDVVDSLLRRVYGKAKQGAGFGHIKVGGYGVLLRGLSPLVATLSTPNTWTSIRHLQAVWDEEGRCWISDAQVAEICYTALAGTRHQLTARLVVRRVRRENPAGQDELLPGFRYHTFFTDTTFSTVEADLTHRAHAVIEQVFADLIDGPLAHLPSVIRSSTRRGCGCAARGQHRRMAPSADRHPRTRRTPVRSRPPRRPSDDRHPAPQADPSAGPEPPGTPPA